MRPRQACENLAVYIAGSSAPEERERIQRATLGLLAVGIKVTSNWQENIAKVGAANPRDASVGDRNRWARDCLRGVSESHVVWFLVPPTSAPTRGAWLEIGYAVGAGIDVVSSGDTKQSIFGALCVEYATDEDALAALVKMAKEVAA